MSAANRHYRIGSEIVLPNHGFDGGVWDLDNTLIGGQNIYDISRIKAAAKIADVLELDGRSRPTRKVNVDYLRNLTIAQSQASYDLAKESTTEASLAWILARAGHFDSHDKYDRTDPFLVQFYKFRQEEHLVALKDHSFLLEGARELLQYGRDVLPYHQAIATMSANQEAAIIFDKFDFEKYMPWKKVITKDDCENPKPDREVNDRGFRVLETPTDDDEQRERIIGIDDSAHGVESEDDAGLFAVGLAHDDKAEVQFIGKPARIVVPSLVVALDFIKRARARAA